MEPVELKTQHNVAWLAYVAGYMKMLNRSLVGLRPTNMTFEDLMLYGQQQVKKEFEEWWAPL